jgi:hypothetical protein
LIKRKAGNSTILTNVPGLLLTQMVGCGNDQAGWVGGNGQPGELIETAAICLPTALTETRTAEGFAVSARACKLPMFYYSHKH